MPDTKGVTMNAWLECYDGNGHYFKKRIITEAQGSSSLGWHKKNFAVDFCEDEWIGDKTTQFSIGNWVTQDAFHFKASYIDTFRGAIPMGMYKFYEDIISDEPRVQERAGLTSFSSKALCHPDGFPCLVFFNNNFYGIYAWQLKKHRDNMSMEKKNAKHIHLEGNLTSASIFGGEVNYDYVEIKNPKNPTSETYGYIDAFSNYHQELTTLESTSDAEVMREAISARYDVTSFIDYIIFSLVTDNYDGFYKNWQFATYDGKKWFVLPYDLDCTLGNISEGFYQMEPQWSWFEKDCSYKMEYFLNTIPVIWVTKYFWDDIKNRYATLRDNGIITPDNIMPHITAWIERLGDEAFEMENAKWPDAYSFSTLEPNDGWVTTDDFTGYSTTEKYDETKTYNTGDRCAVAERIWIATKQTTGVCPYASLGYTDSTERIQAWLTKRIELEDDYLQYNPSSVVEVSSPTSKRDNIRKYIHNNSIFIKDGDAIFNISAQQYK